MFWSDGKSMVHIQMSHPPSHYEGRHMALQRRRIGRIEDNKFRRYYSTVKHIVKSGDVGPAYEVMTSYCGITEAWGLACTQEEADRPTCKNCLRIQKAQRRGP